MYFVVDVNFNTLVSISHFVVTSLSKMSLPTSYQQWVGGEDESSQAVIEALLGARNSMLGIRNHMRKMGEAAGIPVSSLLSGSKQHLPMFCRLFVLHACTCFYSSFWLET